MGSDFLLMRSMTAHGPLLYTIIYGMYVRSARYTMASAPHRSRCNQTYSYSLRRKSTDGELAMHERATWELQSDAFLQCTHRECLHNGPGWLCLYDLHLAKDFALPCLGCWLGPRFDPAKAWDGEKASFLHFGCRNFCQAVRSFVHCDFFTSVPVANASASAPLVMALVVAFMDG